MKKASEVSQTLKVALQNHGNSRLERWFLQILGLFLRPIKKRIVSSERGQSISRKWIGLALQKTVLNGKLIKIRLDFGQKCTLGTKCSGTEQNVLAWNEIFLPAAYHLLDSHYEGAIDQQR